MRLVGGNGRRSGEGAAKGDPPADCLAGAESNVKDLEQWVCWRSEVRRRDGKKTKVPYSPRSGLRARSDDPDTWATLAEAEAAAHKDDYHGTGFVFTARDPFCGVDIDSCVDPETAQTEAWAREIVEELDSYTEFRHTHTKPRRKR